jgi:serine protease Do
MAAHIVWAGDVYGQPPDQQVPVPEVAQFEQQTVRVAEQIGDAVVAISTEYTEQVGYAGMFPDGQFGEDFSERFFEHFFGRPPSREFRRFSMGSGVIIDSDGYILTNEHVVAEAERITVRLPDGRDFEAEVLGADTRTDLAVIKIPVEGLQAAALGDSDDVEIGQWVMAIGNPFSFALEDSKPTVTTGVISGVRRNLPLMAEGNRRYPDLIQTDAAINPGNSGGPLVNMHGQVIGINVAIISTTGGYMGLGFAIPINRAKQILDQLIAGEDIAYGWLGVSVQEVTPDLQNYFGLQQETGVVILDVIAGSPAASAGLETGDVILSVNGRMIDDPSDLSTMVADIPPGRDVILEAVQDNRRRELTVTVGQYPEGEAAAEGTPDGQESDESDAASGQEILGMRVEDITPALSMQYGLPDVEGVVVTSVEADSPADQAGIVAMDIVTHVERRPVRSVEEFLVAVRRCRNQCLIQTTSGFKVLKKQ